MKKLFHIKKPILLKNINNVDFYNERDLIHYVTLNVTNEAQRITLNLTNDEQLNLFFTYFKVQHVKELNLIINSINKNKSSDPTFIKKTRIRLKNERLRILLNLFLFNRFERIILNAAPLERHKLFFNTIVGETIHSYRSFKSHRFEYSRYNLLGKEFSRINTKRVKNNIAYFYMDESKLSVEKLIELSIFGMRV
jgi:hypothetical protein